MTFLEFLAALVDSLAWPALVGYVIYLLRDSFAALLRRLSSVKYKELEAQFREALSEIKLPQEPASAESLSLEDEPSRPDTVSLIELADVSPRVAVMEAWIKIEHATRDYLESAGLDRRYSYQGLRRLPKSDRSKLEPILMPYQELRILRNKAAHGLESDLTPDVARDYIRVASEVEKAIRAASV